MGHAELIESIVAWLPVVVIFGVWLHVMRFGRREYKAHVDQAAKINDEIVAINKEMLAELREIRKALDTGRH